MLWRNSSLRKTPVNFFNLKSYGSRAFAVSAPELRNKLPDDIRSCDNLNLFKRKRKTHLFENYFNMKQFSSYPCQAPRS